jgi:adenylylsulfate kinase
MDNGVGMSTETVRESSRAPARRGCTIWFTGLSGSGKTTTAQAVYDILVGRGAPAELIDGDVIREHLSKGLGFSKADRDTNVRRIGWLSHVLSRHGVLVCAAAISPYEEIREELRRTIGDFLLVYCTAPLEVLERRDVKGLYRKARAGQIKNFTGLDDPYEEPRAPDVVIRSDGTETVEQGVRRVIAALERLGFLR